LDATTIGSLLVGVGAVVGGLVAYLGKRGENALTGYSSLTNDLQEERDRLDKKVGELTTTIGTMSTTINTMANTAAEQSAVLAADQAEIARLRDLVIHHGGHP
jgi:archaellum component FlaC